MVTVLLIPKLEGNQVDWGPGVSMRQPLQLHLRDGVACNLCKTVQHSK